MNKRFMIIFSVVCGVVGLHAKESKVDGTEVSEKKEKTITEQLADRGINVLDESLKKSEALRTQCVNLIMFSQAMDPNILIRGILQQMGISFLPLESLYRIKRSFAQCACENPKVTIGAITTMNPEPFIVQCWQSIMNAVLRELSMYSALLWYYTKFVGYKFLGISKPTRDLNLPFIVGE